MKLLKEHAQNPVQPLNNAPFIYIHGWNGWGSGEGVDSVVPYWGATTGNLMDYLRLQGYECYAVSVGPLNSAWDRACELYAQLTGTTVDYGEAHSKKFNHARFGRKYENAFVPDWGELDEEGKIKQIHLIGHSFGGTTARMLVHLLENGSDEEKAATDPDDLSDLFKGGKKGFVKSLTAVTTPHNSGSVYYLLKWLGIYDVVMCGSILYVGSLGRSPLNGKMVDFHMEQFGLSENPLTGESEPFVKAYKNTYRNREDTCQFELTPTGAKRLNDLMDVSKDIYYFSYPFATTNEVPLLKTQFPRLRTNPVISPLAAVLGALKFRDPVTGIVYDDKWLPNDALVQAEGARHPVDEPFTDYDRSSVEKGIWNVMPLSKGDHGSAVGLLGDKEEVRHFYYKMCGMLNELPE